jgi:hypothetical protein
MNPDGPHFVSLLDRLNRARVDYLVVGGVAVGFNGYVRTTEDLDILIDDAPENIGRLARALAEFGEGYGGGLTAADFPPEEGAVRILEADCPLDLFNRMAGKTYRDFLPETVEKKVPGVWGSVRHLNRRALCALEKNSFREKDRLDVVVLDRLEKGLGLE